MAGDTFLIVGAVQKPHGIRGEVFVRVETDHPDAVFRVGRVLHLGTLDGVPDGRTLTVGSARHFKGGLLVKPAGVTSRTPEVDALRGAALLLPRDEVVPLDEGEVFTHELIGLRVVTDEGEVGTIRDLYDAPGGVLLAVDRPGGRRELLIPFVQALVRRIDVDTGILELDAPPGLLEL